MSGSIAEMFSDCHTTAERGERFENYKEGLTKSISRHDTGQDRFLPKAETGCIVKGGRGSIDSLAERVASITKSLSPEDAASITAEMQAVKASQADLQKDWNFAGPSGVQLVPYDLEEPAKMLVPRFTPFRNDVTREKGQGTGRQFKRILGITNSGTGGVPDLSPFMNSETVQTSFGSLALRRGQKISYSADQQTVPYEEMGYSDQVNTKAYFSSLGFQDVRQLSKTALLWAHLLGEEKAMYYARGTASPYAGAIVAPVIGIVGSATGGTIPAATYSIKVTAKGGFGESVVSNAPTYVAGGATSSIAVTVSTEPAGSMGVYNLYAGTAGSETFQTSFVGNTFTLTTFAGGGAAFPAADSSADANGFDGFLPSVLNPANGASFTRVNGTLNAIPGKDFQTLFLNMWNLVFADPDEIWTTAAIRNALGAQLEGQGSTNYRITLESDASGKVIGQLVTGIINKSSPDGKMLDLRVHPYAPAGTAFVRSKTLPIPDSEVTETSKMVMVQDYMSVDWPQIQFTYDESTYTFGTMVHQAPKWNGALVGIQTP